ncbi:protein kinase domain-containing protein [Rubinisphaera italica]|uniref:Serine/threonine-protein kinase PrkC n=1 Tax=Rubinisphaera italica TaxID=2527969 RepID=A0A5C5XFT9_9PLAN|nr:protein kinase [Rubinisphaera italica]TWT61860.1 Serine/threonine-protein kinase PrkC [Rubinisphaera italica]
MYDPPSRELIARLEQYTTCREQDVLGCRSIVHALSRDLPAFDSTWLDALVQRRKLTSFQAEALANHQEHLLRVGSYFVVDLINNDHVQKRYLAQSVDKRTFYFLDAFPTEGQDPHQIVNSLEFQERNQLGKNRLTDFPVDFVATEQKLFAVNEYHAGITAQELIVRQGRLPEELLRTIALQLHEKLKRYQSLKFVHGDIRAGNLLLSRKGSITILNAGVRPQVQPVWTLQTRLPYECYDLFAPEMIRTGVWTHETDLYAAGCLLWQLACGRPPHYSADALYKISAHIEKRIPPVLELAPEVDRNTAAMIDQLTQADPVLRTQSTSAVRLKSRIERPAAPQIVSTFVRKHEQPRLIIPRTRFDTVRDTTALLTAAACLLILFWQAVNLIPSQSWITATGTSLIANITGDESNTADSVSIDNKGLKKTQLLLELPKPNDQGLLQLTAGKRYRASDISVVGALTVEVSGEPQIIPGSQTEIVVAEKPWKIWATDLELNNITVRYDDTNLTTEPSEKSPPPALLVCQSLNLRVSSCRFLGPRADNSDSAKPVGVNLRSIAWKPLSGSESNAGHLHLSGCQFLHDGSSLMLSGEAKEVAITNSLKLGSGDFIEIVCRNAGKALPLVFCNQTTLRNANSLLHLDCTGYQFNSSIQLDIEATNCVIDLNESSKTLVVLTSPTSPERGIRAINLLGQMLLVTEQTTLASWWNSNRGLSTTISTEGTVEGVMPYQLEFAGTMSEQPQDSELKNYTGPRWNSVIPGIQATQMTAVTEPIFRR